MTIVSDPTLARRFTTDRIIGFGPERVAAESALERAGIVLPLQQRARWQRLDENSRSILIVVWEVAAGPVGAVSLSIGRSRALPGHKIYRVERLTGVQVPRVNDLLVSEIAAIASRDHRCLRVVIDVFDRSAEGRQSLGRSLSRAGFRPVANPRLYSQTVALDLQTSEEAIFAGLHATARRHVRAATKHGLRVRTIDRPESAALLRELSRQTFHRTGSSQQDPPWEGIIALSVEQPAVSRLVGVFAPLGSSSETLVSYAWGVSHGARAAYESAGSIRHPLLGNLPVGYAALWSLIAWAREYTTASWFDFGGITPGSSADSRAGISRFKRYFSNEVVDVGEEWRLAPHPARDAIASTVGGIASWASERVDGLRRGERRRPARPAKDEARPSL